MKRIAWLTDLHLNFLSADRVDEFLATVATERPDAVLIGGDIAESPDICDYLDRLNDALAAPIYFVLGNHDYYLGSIAETRARVVDFCDQRPGLHFLTGAAAAFELTQHVGLVGHDGWADGRAGDYLRSMIGMTDYRVIAELASLDKQTRWDVLRVTRR